MKKKHLYLEQVNETTSDTEKIEKGKYVLFYTQGIGKFYLVACKKKDEKEIRDAMQHCVEDYLTGDILKKIRLIEVPCKQSFPGPSSIIRALWQNAATMMFEGEIIL